MEKLLFDHETSYALVGPSRIGKTSLAREFMNRLRLTRDPRAERAFFLNFQDLALKTDDAVAQAIAKTVSAGLSAEKMTADKLKDFLSLNANKLGGPLQLVMDECDEVCDGWTFDQLCEWSRQHNPVCRLVALGKSHLVRKVLMGGEKATSRLAHIRPRPLAEPEAWRLFSEPMRQLGLEIQDEAALRLELWRRTGGLPHLVQDMGKMLANHACDVETGAIGSRLLKDATDSFLGMARLRGHLDDIKQILSKIAALVVLCRDGEHATAPWTARRLEHDLALYGVTRPLEECMSLLDDLVLHNFLIWENGIYLPGRWDFRYIAIRNRDDVHALVREKIDLLKSGGT